MGVGPDKNVNEGNKEVNHDHEGKSSGGDRALTKEDAKNIREGIDKIGNLNDGKEKGL